MPLLNLRCPFIRPVATVALMAALLLPGLALASGSWAVPRFTPTWAELERDLRLLGLKSRPIARRPRPIAPAAVAATAVPNSSTEPVPVAGTSPGAAAAAGGSTAGTSNAPGGTDTAGANVQCKCSEPPPPPKCPEVAPAAPAVADPVKKKKRPSAPADPKKLDRKKYWWQEN